MKKMLKPFILTALLLNGAHSSLRAYHNEERNESPFFLGIDYLYWKAGETQTQYAVKTTGSFNQGFISVDEYLIANPCFSHDSGVRFNAGYAFCDCWDATLSYTHFKTCALNSVSQANGILATAIFQLIENFFASTAQSNFTIKLDTIDLEAGTYFDVCDDVIVRPHFGIKWAQINQKQTITYTGIPFIDPAVAKKCNNFSGTGLRCGIDAQWYFYEDFSLIGDISGALLAGKFNTNVDYLLTANPPFVDPAITFTPKVINCTKRIAPMTQIFLGVNWESSCSCVLFDISLGYEAQYWWQQWQSVPSVVGMIAANPSYGDFSTQGLTLQLGVRF